MVVEVDQLSVIYKLCSLGLVVRKITFAMTTQMIFFLSINMTQGVSINAGNDAPLVTRRTHIFSVLTPDTE